MLIGSLLLLFLAAVLHAFANVLMKRSRVKLAFVWWMLTITTILGVPLWFYTPQADADAWRIVMLSGVLETVYFLTLTKAYSTGDLSVVYPIARGSAPLFLLIWAILFLGERPTPAGYIGIVCIAAGLYLINLPAISAWNRPPHAFVQVAPRWALLTGLLISAYTVIDKVGVRSFTPVLYLYYVMCISWILLSVQWFFADRRKELIAEISDRSRSIAAIAAAFAGTAGYTLVLAAMRLTPVSYVGPVREVSVVMGAWYGIRFMGEKGGALRIVATTLVVAGIALIAIAG